MRTEELPFRPHLSRRRAFFLSPRASDDDYDDLYPATPIYGWLAVWVIVKGRITLTMVWVTLGPPRSSPLAITHSSFAKEYKTRAEKSRRHTPSFASADNRQTMKFLVRYQFINITEY